MAKSRFFSKSGAGAAGFVIAAAVFGALCAADALNKDEAPAGPAATEMSRPAVLGWSIPEAGAIGEGQDSHLISKDLRQNAALAAIAGLVSSLVALFGANKLLQMLAGVGRSVGTATAKAAEVPVRAAKKAAGATAKATAKATGHMLKGPGRWLMTVVGLTVFALTGIAFLDVQWEAGLLAGAGISAAAIWGWNKTGRALSRVSPFRAPAASEADAVVEPTGKTA